MKIADMHCDTISALEQEIREGRQATLLSNSLHVDIEKLKKGDYILQNFAVFLDKMAWENPDEQCRRLITLYQKYMEQHSDVFCPILCRADLDSLSESGKIGSVLTMEEGAPLGGSIERLTDYYHRGVRMIALTWNYPNEIGHPNFDSTNCGEHPDFTKRNTEQGLTRCGIEIVRQMEHLGVVIDVSHASDALFYDVLKYTKKPFAASHSNAQAVCNVARNLTDDMIRAIADRGGVVGINFCADFVQPNSENMTYHEDLVKHIRHMMNIGGVECVGFGADLDGIDNKLECGDASGMQQIVSFLLQKGFTNSQVEAICYKNVLRLYRDILH